MNEYLSEALFDFKNSISSWRLWCLMAWQEIQLRYNRSVLGPFWLTISMAIMIAALGCIYGILLKADLAEYFPFLTIGLITWGLLSSIINEGCMVFIYSGTYLKQINISRQTFLFQMIWRNLIIYFHNFVIIIFILVIFGVKSWVQLSLFIPALALFLINSLWIATVVSILSARYRDLPQIIASIMQVSFYATPILFHKDMLREFTWLMRLNPFAYLIDLVRGTLMGSVDSTDWIVCSLMALIGLSIAFLMLGRYNKRIPYWV